MRHPAPTKATTGPGQSWRPAVIKARRTRGVPLTPLEETPWGAELMEHWELKRRLNGAASATLPTAVKPEGKPREW